MNIMKFKIDFYIILIIILLVSTNCKKEDLPEYTLNLNCQPYGYGRVLLSPLKSKYLEGTVVRLSPAPNKDYRFDSWTGPDAIKIRSSKITMDKDMVITANFVILNTELKIIIVEQPKGGQNVTSLTTNFIGSLSGKLLYTDVFVELMWENYAHSSSQLVGTMNFTITPSNLAISATYEAPSGYYLTGYFWFRISWTDDYGHHYIESQKALCTAGKKLNENKNYFDKSLLNGVIRLKEF
jgi:hypothetical protein